MDPKELLEKLSKDPEVVDSFTKPELLAAVDVLTAYITEKATAIKDGSSDDPTADLAAAKEARDRLDRVTAVLTSLNEEAAKISAEADALTDGLTAPAAEVEEQPEKVEVETVVDEVETETADEVENEPALVASKPSLGAIAARKSKSFDAPVEEKRALVASVPANIEGFSRFDSGFDVAKAALAQHKRLGNLRPEALTQYPIARFENDWGAEVVKEVGPDFATLELVKRQAEDDARRRIAARLAGKEALVAAIPTPCGPSEIVREFFSVSSMDGLLAIPTVNASRGGLVYPVSPAYPDIVGDTDWNAAIGVPWDDANPKPFFLIECADTHECVVVPYPTRLRFRNWEQRYNPEYVSHVMGESLVVHAHKMNAVQIAAIKALATNTGITGFGGGTNVSIANTLAFAAARLRDTYRASQTAPVSVLAPFWVRDAMATDLITRNSTLSMENARARSAALFAGFDLDVQWLYDTESIVAANQFPTIADFTLFFPGSYVRLDGGGLTINETRDSTLNGLNQFEFFMETSEVVCEVGPKGIDVLDVPVCPSGVTGGSVTDLCGAAS